MIPIPPNVYRGQHLRADDINAIHDVLRRLRPIAGDNVRISEGPGGITISALPPAAPPQESTRHAWQLIAQRLGSALRLILIPGKVYRVRDLARTEIAVTPADDFPLAEASGVYVGTLTALSSSGTASLILRQDQETPDTLRLAFASPDSSTLAVIADLSRDTAPHVTQRVTGDIYLSEGASEPVTAAWTVRLVTLSDDHDAIPQWCVYAPTWVTRSRTLSLSDGWYSLPAPSSGTPVCAVLKMTVSADESAAVAVDSLIVTDDPDQYQDVAPIPPSGTGSSSDEGSPGIAYWKVTIGTFRTGASGLIFDSRHIGLIIADPSGGAAAPAESWCISPPEIVQKNGTPYQVAYYCRITRSASGIFSVEKTDYLAYEIECQTHGNDHKNGVL